MMTDSPKRAATIYDIARLTGSSKSAVSRALRNEGDVSPEARERVLRAAAEVGYVTNAMAQGLASGRTGRIGLLIRNSSNPVYGAIHTAMQRRAEEVGMSIVVVTVASPDFREKERAALSTLISLQIDGLIVCSGTMPSEDVEVFLDRIPIMTVARPESSELLNAISYDEAHAGRILADHLLDLGHRRVAVVDIPRSSSLSVHTRTQAMIARLRRRGATPIVVPSEHGVMTGEQVDSIVADDRITAVMCPYDAAMVECLDMLRLRGVSVPGRLSVTGCDGVGVLGSDYLGLTTYRLPVDETGRRAVDRMRTLTMGDASPEVRHERVRGSLIMGRTTSSPID
jgi:DNA-binding LacI/PurR family transcriptional regulator